VKREYLEELLARESHEFFQEKIPKRLADG
jgi:hypothetical protein